MADELVLEVLKGSRSSNRFSSARDQFCMVREVRQGAVTPRTPQNPGP